MMKAYIRRISMAAAAGLLLIAAIQLWSSVHLYGVQKENVVATLAISARGVYQNLDAVLINKNLPIQEGLAAASMQLELMQKPLNGLGYGLLEYSALGVRNRFIQDNPEAKILYVSDTCRNILKSLDENNTLSNADERFLLNLMNASNNFLAKMYDETGNLVAEALNPKYFNDSLAAYVAQIYKP